MVEGGSMLEAGTLWELIEARAAASPGELMAVDETRRELTFAQYRDRVERAAAGLAVTHGIGPGDVVTWQLPTWIESMVLVGAISRLGATQNPVLPIYRAREVGFCTRQADAKLLVVPAAFANFDFVAMAEQLAGESEHMSVLVSDRSLPEGDPSTLPEPPVSGDEVRWLFYTSGTTADPKGARHTDRTIHAVARGMAQRLAVTDTDRNALAFPFTHIGGITWLFTSLMTGMANILFAAFVPDVVVGVLSAEGVTLAGSGTAFHQTYLAAQRDADGPIFPEVRCFPGGGAPKPVPFYYEMKEAFGVPIVSGYGLTEAPILTMGSVDDRDDDLAETEGAPMPGVELRLVKLDGSPADAGEEGEVRAKAPQLMLGYLDTSLDADAFDEDGFFRTGDLGTLNERNMLAITGRLKDIIIRKGENVSAKEVEDLLFAHPQIADVAVIGLPDEDRGELVCAVVSTPEGTDPIPFDEMVRYLKASGLMTQKVPERLEHVDVVPRNPTGKILKHELRKTYGG
jgi:acyl-CoA synthetase (AMP-forming)/AMP-acid ligase II